MLWKAGDRCKNLHCSLGALRRPKDPPRERRARQEDELESRFSSLAPPIRSSLTHLAFSWSSTDDKPTLKVVVTGLAPRPVSQPALDASEASTSVTPSEERKQTTTTTQELVLLSDAIVGDIYKELEASGES